MSDTDIVERLRSRRAFGLFGARWMELTDPDKDCQDAADEIERLRAALRDAKAWLEGEGLYEQADAIGIILGDVLSTE